jgi:hypothetical protein
MYENENARMPMRVPTYEDYATGTQVLDYDFKQEGGAWVAFQRESLLDAQTKRSVFRLHYAMASIARLIEPVFEEDLSPKDAQYRVTHAFRAGMWTGRRLMGLVYNAASGMEYAEAHTALARALPNEWNSNFNQLKENRDALITMGYGGLDVIGGEARDHLGTFSGEIIPNERYRKEYLLGAGAVLFTAHGLYSVAYNKIRVAHEAAQLFDAEELDSFLIDAANSGETE